MLGERVARKTAEQVLDDYGVEVAEHIRLEDMAWDMGVEVVIGPLMSAAARLSILGDKATIRVREGDDENRIRFSIAHELGHWKLHQKKIQKLITCQEIDFVRWSSDSALEAEANTFAAELLLPTFLLKKKCNVREVNFNPVKKLAVEFCTSLTATALRFVEVCPEACAVALSEGGKISWFRKNEDFWPRLKAPKAALDKLSLTYDFFVGKDVSLNPEEVSAEAWSDDDRLGDTEFVEHVVPMPNLGVALTLLWLRS